MFSKDYQPNKRSHKPSYGMLGKKHSEETKAKIRAKLMGHKSFGSGFFKGHGVFPGSEKGWFKKENENINWKGDNAGYRALHTWVAYHRGRPKECEHCGTTTARQFDWANKSHEYKRDLNDWLRLCASCHTKYDYESKKEKKHKW